MIIPRLSYARLHCGGVHGGAVGNVHRPPPPVLCFFFVWVRTVYNGLGRLLGVRVRVRSTKRTRPAEKLESESVTKLLEPDEKVGGGERSLYILG